MSEPNRNVTGGKVGAKTSNTIQSSQHVGTQSETNNSSKSLKDSCYEADQNDVIFDSGIQLESNLSSGVISESDIKYVSSSGESECGFRLSNEGTCDVEKSELPSDNYKSNVMDSMRLDSGIDIDVSDQFCGSRTDNYLSTEIIVSEEITDDKVHNEPESAKEVITPNDINFWELYFEPDDDGNTRLHLAIIQGYEEYIRRILQFIPDSHYLNIRNHYRQTCLHLTVLCNRPKITRLLLLAGAKTGIEDRNGNTALHVACKTNNLECIKALLSPLTVYEQKYTVFKYNSVIDSPTEYINEYNYDGLSCMHMAAVHPDLKVLHQLFLNGGDVNIRECKAGFTILHNAVSSGNINLVNYVLEHSGIDVDRKNYARLTPYQLSASYPRIANILLKKGATPLSAVEDDESDEDYSSDESDSEYDLFDDSRNGYNRISQVTDMIYSLSTNDITNVSSS